MSLLSPNPLEILSNISYPYNNYSVSEYETVTGTISGLFKQRAFLVIQSTAYNKKIFPQGEVVPNNSGEWSVNAVYRSVGNMYTTYVVVTSSEKDIEILSHKGNRSDGIFYLPKKTSKLDNSEITVVVEK